MANKKGSKASSAPRQNAKKSTAKKSTAKKSTATKKFSERAPQRPPENIDRTETRHRKTDD